MNIYFLYYLFLFFLQLNGLYMLFCRPNAFSELCKGALISIGLSIIPSCLLINRKAWFVVYLSLFVSFLLILLLRVKKLPSVQSAFAFSLLWVVSSAIWYHLTEEILLMALLHSVSLVFNIVVSILCHMLIYLSIILWLPRYLTFLLKRPVKVFLVLLFSSAALIYTSWILNQTKFYIFLGQFTGFVSRNGGRAHYILAVSGCFLIAMVLLLCLFLISKIEKLYKLDFESQVIAERNESLVKSYVETNRYYHDMKHHFSAMEYLVNQEDYQSLKEYIAQVSNAEIGIFQIVRTGNTFVDAVLNAKLAEAEKRGIRPIVDVDYPAHCKVQATDICAILANLLDNAIENCSPNDHTQALVGVSIKQQQDFLLMKIYNSVQHNPLEHNADLLTTKKDRTKHGLGLKSVRRSVGKYNGLISFDYNEGVFEVFITLSGCFE